MYFPGVKGYNLIFFSYLIFFSVSLTYSDLNYILSRDISIIYNMVKRSSMTHLHSNIFWFHIPVGIEVNHQWIFIRKRLKSVIRKSMFATHQNWYFICSLNYRSYFMNLLTYK